MESKSQMTPMQQAEAARYKRLMEEIEKKYDGNPPPVGGLDRVQWQKLHTRIQRLENTPEG